MKMFSLARAPFATKFICLAPLLFIGEQSLALNMDNEEKSYDNIFFRERINMRNESKLTLNGGGSLRITAESGSTVNLNNAQVTHDSGGAALSLVNSHAFINGGSITSTGGAGLQLARVATTADGGSSAVVNGAKVIGQTGAVVTAFSVLQLSATHLEGTTGVGLLLREGTVEARNGSVITGKTNGVEIGEENADGNQSHLTLDNSTVIGQNGAAIVVDNLVEDVDAVINVNNGSSLQGTDNVLLQVNSGSSATLNVSNSNLTGHVVVDGESNAAVNLMNGAVLTGRLENVDSLSVNSQAQWVMVEDSSVQNLDMASGGSIKFGGPGDFYTLSVENLSGNGIFEMEADFSQGLSDTLEVTGNATGSHEILVHSSGADPLSDARLLLVQTAGGDAQFALLGGEVDLGTWSYGLAQDGNDWYLDASTRKISPGARTALAVFEATPTVLYAEQSILRSRMGEIRMNDSKAGGWMRSYGNKFNVSAEGGGYSQVQQGVAFGADATLPYGDGQWLIGVMAGYSTSDLDMGRGTSGEIDSYHVGAYSTWLQADGWYVDGMLKLNRFDNSADVRLSDGQQAKGDFSNGAVSASVEVGRHIKLDDGWFVEPYTQLIGAVIQGDSYTLDNGLQVDGERSRSLLGKAGMTVGRDFLMDNQVRVQPYVRAALAHEFINNNEARVNDNRFTTDLSGSRGELGAGIAVALTDRITAHADFDYSDGDKIEQPWGANVGVRYSW